MNKSRPWWVAIALVLAIAVVVALLNVSACLSAYFTGTSFASVFVRPSVGIIRIDGLILSGQPPTPRVQGVTYSEQVIELIDRAAQDRSIKAVVLRVNSPGGSVVGSNEIYQALLKLKKPIVVSMGEMAASGGYYISCAATKIVVNPATLTGSIGVIAEMPNVSELLKKIGVEMNVIKSGRLKDEGSPFRPMTDEERAVWQAIINEAYDQFVSIVAKGRNLPEAKVRELADGRVYTGLQALRLNLADQEGNLNNAIDLASQLAGIVGKPHVVEFRTRPTLLESLLYFLPSTEMSVTLKDILGVDLNRPALQYLYRGG